SSCKSILGNHTTTSSSYSVAARFLFVARTPLNYHSSAIATRVETFNRSEEKTAIVLWCSTDRGHAAIGFQVSGLLSVGRDRLMPKPPRQSEKAIIPKVQAGLRIHALAQVYQTLVETVDSNQTQPPALHLQHDHP